MRRQSLQHSSSSHIPTSTFTATELGEIVSTLQPRKSRSSPQPFARQVGPTYAITEDKRGRRRGPCRKAYCRVCLFGWAGKLHASCLGACNTWDFHMLLCESPDSMVWGGRKGGRKAYFQNLQPPPSNLQPPFSTLNPDPSIECRGSETVAAVHLLLLTPLGERESWRAGEWFPYLYTDTIVPLDKFASLVLQVQ